MVLGSLVKPSEITHNRWEEVVEGSLRIDVSTDDQGGSVETEEVYRPDRVEGVVGVLDMVQVTPEICS